MALRHDVSLGEVKLRPSSIDAVENLFEVRGISKRFGGTTALHDVSFSVSRGEIIALLGENGAGKSTLIKIMAGVFRADSGSLLFKGQAIAVARKTGSVAFIHQDLGLIPWMTVAENMMLGTRYPRRGGLIDWQDARRQASEALALVGGGIDPDDRVATLTRTEKSLVAIARALASEAELIVLDEPTASLPQSEVDRLHDVLRALRDRGVGMIYVSHRLDEVYALTDRVVILRDGSVVASERTVGLDADHLVRLIIGRSPDQLFVRPAVRNSEADLLRLEGLCAGDVGPINLVLGKGEVVGLVGLRGAGQDLIGKTLFGVEKPRSGRMLLSGERFTPRDAFSAIAQGVLMVAGDRSAESIAHGMSIRENMFLNPVASGRSLLSPRTRSSEDKEALQLGTAISLKPNSPSALIETLSGGNQQKVVMARWMKIGGKLLILEDPTAGVDVGAKAEIYRLLADTVERDQGVLLISTDFEEVTAICHRAYVFRAGRIVAELAGEGLSIEALMNAASLSPRATAA